MILSVRSIWLAVLVVLSLAFFVKGTSAGPAAAEPNSLAANVTSTVTNVNATAQRAPCRKYVRKEWRAMTLPDRLSYLKAVQCLMQKNSSSGISGAETRFDDFQALHISLTTQVHEVGQFIPWHRWFLYLYESNLRDLCGFKGATPYWDWSKDANAHSPNTFLNSPVFDSSSGFGSLTNGPLRNGPFAGYRLKFGQGPPFNRTRYTIERGFNSSLVKHLTHVQVNFLVGQLTFEDFRIQLEGEPFTPVPRTHDGGHSTIGGNMGDPYSSPGDPIFYLHHGNLDRLWWKWQQEDPATRLSEISGRSTQQAPFQQITLDYVLQMGKVGRSVPIRDVMDIENDVLCYTYV